MVLNAGNSLTPEAQSEALEHLCHDYWYPLYAFLRRSGKGEADAKDLTQGFFERLLYRKGLKHLQEKGGRFRSYLLTALKNYVATEWHKDHAQKRGGGTVRFSIDDDAGAQYDREPAAQHTPETLYHRSWAFALLLRVKEALSQEYDHAGKTALYQSLQGFLGGKSRLDSESYLEVGERHGMSEAAITMAVKRMRRRYGELLRNEIAHTVSNPDEIDEEIGFLLKALAS